MGENLAIAGRQTAPRRRLSCTVDDNGRMCEHARYRAERQPLETHALNAGNAVRAAERSAHWPDADWWRAYGDAQLDSLVSTALAGSPDARGGRCAGAEARSLAGVAAAALEPHVTGNLSLTREHWPDNPLYYGPGELANQNTWNNTGTLGFSYRLDLWRGDEREHERALDTAHQRVADARAGQLELAVNLVRAYVDFAKHYALRDIAADTLARQQELSALARRRLAGGIGTSWRSIRPKRRCRNTSARSRPSTKPSNSIATNSPRSWAKGRVTQRR